MVAKRKHKNKIVFKRHLFWNYFYRPWGLLLAKLKHYERRSFLKMKKGDSYIILSNHQTGLDGIFLPLSFSRHLYGVLTDSFLSKGWIAKMFQHQLGIIGKKKGAMDLKANADMMRCLNEGGSLLIFPEGNRSYAEFQFTLTDGFSRFLKFFKKPIVLFNFHGGIGVDPRFGNKRRKGQFYGEIKRILQYEEYKDWSDEELYKVISENLKVYDSDSGELYKSKTRAEYLERMLFVCPKCGKVETLVSKGNFLTCKECGLRVEYAENLHFKSEDKSFKFDRLVDWYNYQVEFVKNFKPNGQEIFHDEFAKLYISRPGKKRKLVAKGPVVLTEKSLKFLGKTIDIAEIEIASPINGTNFNFSTSDNEYLVMGKGRFNPLKYVLMFNRLDTKMKINKRDVYYNLESRS